MDEHDQCVDAQESNSCENTDGGSLQNEANACSVDEQRNVIAAELQRVAAAAEAFLPDFGFSTDESDNGKTLPKSAQECTARTTVDEFKDLSDDNFSLIDTDDDGFMSEEEIDAAVQNSAFSERDARFVAALKQHQEELEELSDDETGDENDGISRADIAEFDAIQKQMSEERNDFAYARQYAKDNFASLDSDSDGHVTEEEIDAALEAGGLNDRDERSLQTLKTLSGDLEEAHDDEVGDENDGFTSSDLDDYWSQEYAPQDRVQLVWGVQGTMDATQLQAEKVTSRELYPNADDPLRDIVPEAIQQGGVGDCYFNSALASLAATDPQAIADMINDNGDGTYTITFPGAPDEPITVTAPTEQELTLYSHGTEHGLWAPIMAKAYGQYCQESVFRRSPFNLGGGNVPQEGSDGGSLRNAGLRILTGQSVNSDSTLVTSNEDLHESLSSAFRDGRPVTAYINNTPFVDHTSAGLPDAHEYSVIGYDPETQTVRVRNPWGHDEVKNEDGTAKDGVDDGEFTMTLEEFSKEFSGIAYVE